MILKKTSALILKLFGWHLEIQLPEDKKYVLIGAPHTSNWDFPLTLLALSALGLRFSWVAKHTMFKGVAGSFFKAIGGIPVNRNIRQGFIEQMVNAFKEKDALILTIAPEGTRSRRAHWKPGFYHIALKAGVCVCLASINYPTKTICVNGILRPTGDIISDFQLIRDFYKGKTGKHPHKQSEISIQQKDKSR